MRLRLLADGMAELLEKALPPRRFGLRPLVTVVVGVNGVGKTTSIAKLARRARERCERVVLAAADTFRAGARRSRRGATVVRLPEVAPAPVVADLYGRGVRSVLVEGGGEVLASFAASGLYDRVAVAAAPLLIGGRGAPGPLGGEGFRLLGEAPRLEGLAAGRRGPDVVLTARRAGAVDDLLARVLPA